MRFIQLASFFMVCLNLIGAQGSKPFLTERPIPVADQKWELNVFFASQSTTYTMAFDLPSAEFRYGFRNKWEFRFQTGANVFFRGAEPGKFGVKDFLIGGKWFFYEDPARAISIATAPRIVFRSPLSSRDSEISSGDTSWVFPLGIGYRRGPFGATGEVALETHSITTSTRFLSVNLTYEITKTWEAGAEVLARTFNDNSGAQSLVHFGGQYRGWTSYALFGMFGWTTVVPPGSTQDYFTMLGFRYQPTR